MSKTVLVLGADGYIGWPLCRFLAGEGYEVHGFDNYYKRECEARLGIKPLMPVNKIGNKRHEFELIRLYELGTFDRMLDEMLEHIKPDAIIHLAEQPSAPYSQISRGTAIDTQVNNVIGTLNLIFAIKSKCPDAHIIKLGSMGEYGTPNIDIEEGWLNVEHMGRTDRMLYPKKPGSFYHLSKVHDSANLEYACRTWDLRCTDLNQGVVYGCSVLPDDYKDAATRTSFHYDAIFGTVINRFLLQALLDIPLTIYGAGKQKRSFIHIKDVMKCIKIAIDNPANPGEFRVFNQFTEVKSIEELALAVSDSTPQSILISNIDNPRAAAEAPVHHYNPVNSSLLRLGLDPIKIKNSLSVMLNQLDWMLCQKDANIDYSQIQPTVKWRTE